MLYSIAAVSLDPAVETSSGPLRPVPTLLVDVSKKMNLKPQQIGTLNPKP